MSNDMHFTFEATRLPESTRSLRAEVRQFLGDTFDPECFEALTESEKWKFRKKFASEVAARGWIGMTWPKRYGGQERSFLDRFVVNEEMQVAHAPIQAYFVADRQSGPTIMRYGSDKVKALVLPKIIDGKLCFCIGMSEPDSGSDLFAAKTRATKVENGWLIDGTKIWTTNANYADYMIGLFRTAPASADNRRHGLTSFLVDMRTKGIDCRPIQQMNGEADFNEVHFEKVFIPDEYVIGNIHEAWKQATTELAYERSGPERFLETFPVLVELLRVSERRGDPAVTAEIGRLVAQLHSLRRMSLSVAGLLQGGKEPIVEAAMVKDLGTRWEQRLPQLARYLVGCSVVDPELRRRFDRISSFYFRTAPKLTIQGGTTEILRGIIARGLRLR